MFDRKGFNIVCVIIYLCNNRYAEYPIHFNICMKCMDCVSYDGGTNRTADDSTGAASLKRLRSVSLK